MEYKLTLDSNLVNAKPVHPAITTLKRWEKEGKIELIEADRPKNPTPAAYGWPGAPPRAPENNNPHRGNMRTKVRKPAAGGPDFKGVAAILFPHKDPLKLNMGEINNVAHMLIHQNSKNEFFVTDNVRDFLSDGRRERLKASIGVVAVTPDEMVAVLEELEGWK